MRRHSSFHPATMKTFFHYMLALMMLVTGSINTLSAWLRAWCRVGGKFRAQPGTPHAAAAAVKAADRQASVGSTTDGYTNEPRPFVHPL